MHKRIGLLCSANWEKQFNIGLQLETENNLSTLKNIRNQLKTHEIAFAHQSSADDISVVYVSLKNSHAILKMGHLIECQ